MIEGEVRRGRRGLIPRPVGTIVRDEVGREALSYVTLFSPFDSFFPFDSTEPDPGGWPWLPGVLRVMHPVFPA